MLGVTFAWKSKCLMSGTLIFKYDWTFAQICTLFYIIMKLHLPNMCCRPRVVGEFESLWQLPKSIHVDSKSSIVPDSWKWSTASEMSLLQGEPFGIPIPYPDLPKRSPTVVKSQSWEVSWNKTGLSQMNAFSSLKCSSKWIYRPKYFGIWEWI